MLVAMSASRITLDTPGVTAARAGAWLELRCGYCRHKAAIGPNDYGREVGERPLRVAGDLARCRECGTRGKARVTVLPFER